MLLAATGPSDCPPGRSVDYVCGIEHPEDVVTIPGTHWLIASGYSPGAGLTLVDVDAHVATRFYEGRPSEIDADHAAYPDCPTAVDPAQFSAHGLSLRRTDASHYVLHVVNHGGRESVEVFDVSVEGGRPAIRWRGCRALPPGQVGNAVATFADGTVMVTVLTRPGTTIADFVLGRKTGAVWEWPNGGRAFREVPGTRLPGNNGLETAPDGRHFYVVAFGLHAVLVYDRHQPHAQRTIVMPDFMPDNIHWVDGRLVAAGMRLDEPACGGRRRIIDGTADKMLCHRGYVVAAVDPVAGTVSTIAYAEPEPAFNGVSAAAIAGGVLWLGSYQADRVAYRPLPAR